MFGARQSTRDVAVEARSLTQAHIDECKRWREITRQGFAALKKDLDGKHEENKRFQNRIYLGTIAILLSVIAKILADSFHFHLGL